MTDEIPDGFEEVEVVEDEPRKVKPRRVEYRDQPHPTGPPQPPVGYDPWGHPPPGHYPPAQHPPPGYHYPPQGYYPPQYYQPHPQIDPWSIPPDRDEHGRIKSFIDRLNPFLSLILLMCVFGLAFLITFPVVIAVLFASASAEDYLTAMLSPVGLLALLLIQDIILVLLPYYVYVKPKYIPIEDLGLDTHNLPSRLTIGIAVGAAVATVITLIEKAMGQESSGGLPVGPETWSVFDFVVMVIGVSVVAPITEEFFFRGIMFKGALKYFEKRKSQNALAIALLYSSFMFAIIHGYDIFGALAVFSGGLIFAYLYYKTDSLITPIIGHATYNFILVTAAYVGFV